MNDPIVIIGMGEIGGVFARGFLKLGHPVFPVTRQMDMHAAARRLPDPRLVLVTVAENDLDAVLANIPKPWRTRVGLVQNELLPRDWERHGIEDPTVVSVWFEKKKGQDVKVLVPSPVHGPGAPILIDALAALQIPAWQLARESELEFELVRKNLYILTTNIAGLQVGGTVDELWTDNETLARAVMDDILKIQFALIGHALDRETLLQGMLSGFKGDPAHKCMGRTALTRLTRALDHADTFFIEVPHLRAIAASVS